MTVYFYHVPVHKVLHHVACKAPSAIIKCARSNNNNKPIWSAISLPIHCCIDETYFQSLLAWQKIISYTQWNCFHWLHSLVTLFHCLYTAHDYILWVSPTLVVSHRFYIFWLFQFKIENTTCLVSNLSLTWIIFITIILQLKYYFLEN